MGNLTGKREGLTGGAAKRFPLTDKHRRLVRDLAASGVGEREICKRIINPNTGCPLSVQTLERRFRKELWQGRARRKGREALELMARVEAGDPHATIRAMRLCGLLN